MWFKNCSSEIKVTVILWLWQGHLLIVSQAKRAACADLLLLKKGAENKNKKTWQYLQYVFLVSSSTTSGLSLLFDLPMIFSSPPHLQIHFGTKHLLLPPLQSAPLPKTHRNEDRFRCDNTEETRETHYCFALEEGRKKSKSGFRSEGSQTPEGPDEDGLAGCWVYVSAAECLSDGLMSSQWSVKSGVWICCYLRPWIQESLSGWAEHARSLTVILCSSHSSHPAFPTTISTARAELM